MDRFSWYKAGVALNEEIWIQKPAVCLYDGETKTPFETGTVSLTPVRMIWADSSDPDCRLCLHLSLVLGMERHGKTLMRSGKIILHLAPCPSHLQGQGPATNSKYSYVRLSFRHGGDDDFSKKFKEALEKKQWQKPNSGLPNRHPRTGIVGIERRLAEHNMRTSDNISQAFEDLSQLMGMAKDMVAISKSISEKIRMKQGDISEDDTVRFKSFLLSLGVSDPVTKDSHGSGMEYYKELSKELSRVLEEPLKEAGGMMTLPDVYCRINRARGLELLSPEDLLNACSMLNKMNLPIILHKFDSGVFVIQLRNQGAETKVEETTKFVESNTALTAEDLAQLVGISVILAKERLLTAEEMGRLCRDETIEGLRFYPNRFLVAGDPVPGGF